MEDAMRERLQVAAEQISEVRRSIGSEGQVYRLDVALQALQGVISLLETSPLSPNGYISLSTEKSNGFPINVVWPRPRKNQRFDGVLLKNGKIRLADGRGPFTPSAACSALVKGSFNGWREWKYLDPGEEQEWLPIAELRLAGSFD